MCSFCSEHSPAFKKERIPFSHIGNLNTKAIPRKRKKMPAVFFKKNKGHAFLQVFVQLFPKKILKMILIKKFQLKGVLKETSN
jgi:hypothetical protein